MEIKAAQNSRSIFKNVLFGFSTWILPLTLSFFATPLIVKSLGNEVYGIYALILGFIGYSFNFSVGRAITKYVAEYRTGNENQNITDIISVTLILNFAISVLGAVLICLSATWLVTDIFSIQESQQEKTIYAFYISSAILFFTMLNQVFNSIFQGIQRFDIYSKLFNAQNLILLAGIILFAVNNYGLIAILLWNLSVIFINSVIAGILSKKLLPEFKFSFSLPGETIRTVLKYSAGIIGYQLLGNILLLFERGWIIRKFGEESLTFYIVPMLLGIYIHSFISSLLLMMFPLASELNQQREKLKKLYLKSTKFVNFLIVFLSLTLIIESRTFLTLWMGNDFAEKSWQLLIVHTLSFGILAAVVASWSLTEGLGYPIFNSLILAVCLIISLILMVYLSDSYGSLGIAVGRLAGFSVLIFSIFYVEKWFFLKVQTKFWLNLVGKLGIAAFFAGFTEWLLSNNLPIGWITFIITVLSGGIIYCLTLFLLKFVNDDDKQLIRNILVR